MSDHDLERWMRSFTLTPDEWAEVALSRATVKKTRRQHLRPYIARVIAEAQQEAVERALTPTETTHRNEQGASGER